MVWGLAGTLMNKAMDTDGVLSEGRVWEEGGRCDQILFSPTLAGKVRLIMFK